MTPTLFDTLEARARLTDPSPSHRAAERANRTGIVRGHAFMILTVLREHGQLDTHGIAAATGLTVEQVDRRGLEMQRAGLIARTDEGGRSLTWRAL